MASSEPTPIGTRWSEEQQRYFADNYISRAINESGVTSGDKFYGWLQDNRLSVSRAVAREAWSQYGQLTNYIDVINVWDQTKLLPRAWYPETNARGAANFTYNIAYQLTDLQSGDTKQAFYTYTSEHATTIAQAVEAFEADFQNYGMQDTFSASGFYVKSIYHKQGAAW